MGNTQVNIVEPGRICDSKGIFVKSDSVAMDYSMDSLLIPVQGGLTPTSHINFIQTQWIEMLNTKDFRNRFSWTLNFNVGVFFLQIFPSTVVILRYNFTTKQKFYVFIYLFKTLKSTDFSTK